MKFAALFFATLFLQTVETATSDTGHARYQRAIALPADASGEACAVLDAAVFAHAASRSANDLRVVRVDGGAAAEVPFALTKSGAQPDATEAAKISDAVVHGNRIGFDLLMPQRPYTRVNLQIAARNFYAVATVTGSNGRGGAAVYRDAPVYLGRFALFDLESQHLSRSTALPLPESELTRLHVELQMWRPPHEVFPGLSTAILLGADVPPSREAQTVYTTVAESAEVKQQPGHTAVVFHVPAHLPIERVSFELSQEQRGDFLRYVTITAKPDASSSAQEIETVRGEISSVQLPLYLDADRDAATVRSLSIDAALAANLRRPATLEVAIDNGTAAPLPIRTVQLQMRQRSICFNAEPGASYALRYGSNGDDALHTPVYNTAPVFQSSVARITATLVAEQLDTSIVARPQPRSYAERHPELLWTGSVGLLIVFGAALRHIVRGRGRRRYRD